MIVRKDLSSDLYLKNPVAKRKLEKEIMKKEVEAKTKIKVSAGDRTLEIICYIIFSIAAFLCLYPFYYIVINTISANDLSAKGDILFWPKGIHFHNYSSAFRIDGLFQALKISLMRTTLGTAFTVFASAYLGFMFTQEKMWLRKVWYRLIVATMYFNAGIIPWYLNMSMLGLTNTFWAYIIPGIVAPYNIILVKTYIESAIPLELQESASLDGASHLKIFWKIILPLSKPILATSAIFGAVGHWNSFQDSLILMQSAPKLYTLQHRLYIYLNTTSNLSALMSAGSTSGISKTVLDSALNGKVIKYTIAMVTIIPILLVYPFMQRYFEKGIMIGAVKG